MPTTPPPALSSWVKVTLLGIAGVCLAIALLSALPSNRYEDPSSDPFLIVHTLDPNNPIDQNYASWGHAEWMGWLSRRNPQYDQAKKRQGSRSRQRMDEKYINTVVIATPEQITAAFQGRLDPYGSYMVWSNRLFPTYIFRLDNKGRYRIYRCPPTYIAVKLIKGKPVHLDKYSAVKISHGNPSYDFRRLCTELK